MRKFSKMCAGQSTTAVSEKCLDHSLCTSAVRPVLEHASLSAAGCVPSGQPSARDRTQSPVASARRSDPGLESSCDCQCSKHAACRKCTLKGLKDWNERIFCRLLLLVTFGVSASCGCSAPSLGDPLEASSSTPPPTSPFPRVILRLGAVQLWVLCVKHAQQQGLPGQQQRGAAPNAGRRLRGL